ncbi:ThuA domain-containing protein [Paraglaciecola aquimarina]|uniref:ThuA domain-containing protein n=1 Tax=Paraglaciecola algarum TaxID=3050085 RepID=A0ABS9D3Q3_9ALTE|nr:ThuA domain-containing protein [Paraglaciecola sp. G1-23]MCF2947072.1 ThuA domain-containing protein [Paraglaciecola sp. G1-23]
MKIIKTAVTILTATLFVACISNESSNIPIKVLIVDGQNNHTVWPKSTFMMKQTLEQTNRFEVDIYRTLVTWKGGNLLNEYALNDGKEYKDLASPETDPMFNPDFSKYDVVISNFGWKAAPWPEQTKLNFEKFVASGGGFVTIHAANNSFPKWKAYNEMIGLGGWGGRNEKDGPYVYFNDAGEKIVDHKKGGAGGHGKHHEFQIDIRTKQHPITKGMPDSWQQTKDELYNRLRGPAKNMTVLATAFDDKKYNGFGRHEPIMMALTYKKGRVFHSTLGHGEPAYQSEVFQTSLVKGTEWAATGKVSQ